MGKRVKSKKLNTTNKFNRYLPVCILLCLLTIILASTFTFFTHTADKGSDIKMSKVELSSETTVGVNGSINNVIPGMPLIDGQVAFSKSADSEDIYVRAKLSFSLPKEYENDSSMQEYINEIRKSADFNINTTEQNGAVWSMKKGNYYYLLNNADTSQLKRVDTIDTYVLSNEIVFPTDMKQLANQSQALKKINFHIAFEAIQADYINPSLESNEELFDITFPAIESEIYVPEEEGIDEFTEGLVFDDGKVVAYFGNSSKVVVPSSYSETGNTKTIEREFDNSYELYGWAMQMQSLAGMGVYNPLPLEITTDKARTTTLLTLETDIDALIENMTYPCYNSMEIEEFKMGDDIKVTEIGVAALCNLEFYIIASVGGVYDGTLVKEVVLPEGLEIIGDFAFAYQTTLAKVNIPSTVKTIGMNPFMYNMGLATIQLPAGLESIGELTENIIPEIVNLSSIPNESIVVTDALRTPEIINDLTQSKVYQSQNEEGTWIFYIADDGAALYGNIIDATTITTPDIGAELTHYYVPSMTTTLNNSYIIPMGAFMGSQISDITLSSAVSSILESAFAGSSIRRVDFGDGVTYIGENALAYCSTLEDVVFGENLTEIGKQAFIYTNLKHLTIPASIQTIGQSAFAMCMDLETVVIEEGVTQLAGSIFMGCVNLLELTLPSTLTNIETGVLSLCNNLVHVYNKSNLDISGVLPSIMNINGEIVTDGNFTNEIVRTETATYYKVGDIMYLINTPYYVTNITADMISRADAIYPFAYGLYSIIQSFEIPSSVKSIGEWAFYNTINLTSIEFPSTLVSIGERAFSSSGLREVSFENCPDVTIGIHAFSYCDYLSSIDFPNNMTVIPEGMYEEAIITELVIPQNIKTISKNAFRDCVNLTTLTLPEGLETIQEYAFYGTSALQEIRIPASLTTLDGYAFGSQNAKVYYNANSADWPFGGLTAETAGNKFGTVSDGPIAMPITALDGDFDYYVAEGSGCLVEGTMITLADGSKKAIEDITYDDLLVTWNYDLGMYEYAYPVWIEQKGSTSTYTKITLDDGNTISAVDVHGIFNADLNRFVNMTVESDEFYVGTKVLVMATDVNGAPIYENGNIKLIERIVVAIEVVNENVNYFQVLTSNYFNVFANDVLTTEGNVILSNRYEFNDNVQWNIELRREVMESGNFYTYSEFAEHMDEYMFEAFGVKEGKYFVDSGYITKEEIILFIVNQATNKDMLLLPEVNEEGKRIWSVSTSNMEAIKVVEGEMFTLGEVDSENFVGWRSSADGKIYSAGDSVKIMFGTHFTAIYR